MQHRRLAAILAALIIPCAAVPAQAEGQRPPDSGTHSPSQTSPGDTPVALELPLSSTRVYAVPPRFTYPIAALRDDIEGHCIIHFTIDAAGVPQDIRPDCDKPVFEAAAREGVANLRMILGDRITQGARFQLPISFRIPG